MRTRLASLVLPALALAIAMLVPGSVRAADVLLVSDANTDVNIADALRVDGHEVTVVVGDYDVIAQRNPTLLGDLSPYDCVIWSASGSGWGGFHAAETFTALSAYVESGGRVLVTGVGSVGYVDTNLVAFLGATGGTGYSGNPGVVADVDTSLSNGPVDLRGVTPTPYEFQYEGLVGVASDAVIVVNSVGGFGSPGAQWTIRGLGSGEIAYVANGSGASAHPSWVATGAGAPGAYNGAIRNFVAASDGSASEPGAPRVRFMAPFTASEGAAIDFAVEVTDDEGDAVEVSWDLDGDGTFGENAGELSYALSAGMTDGEGSRAVAVEAIDAAGNRTERVRRVRIQNAPPTILSTPPETASIAQNLAYVIQATDPAGPLDTLSYELVRGPSSASVIGNVFRFVPTEGDVTAEGVAIDCEVAVIDEDMGRTTQSWRMTVANNYAPSDLVPEFPIGDVVLIDRTPRLSVRGATDIDGDAIQYFFELDRVETFDGPDLIESGAIDEQPGFTSFELTEPLEDGHYYWRAWLTDGTAVTTPRVSSFWIVTAMGEVADAGLDASGTDGGTSGPSSRGCACRAGGASAGQGGLALLGLAILGLVRARRNAVKRGLASS